MNDLALLPSTPLEAPAPAGRDPHQRPGHSGRLKTLPKNSGPRDIELQTVTEIDATEEKHQLNEQA
jgi:hypothetical protein